jgi:hypothetical protein
MAIGDRKRVTVQAVGGLELPLEVGAPAIVGSEDLRSGRARVANASAAAFLRNEAVPLEDLAPSRARGQLPAAVTPLNDRQKLAGAPRGVVRAQVDQRLNNVFGGAIGCRIGLRRAILEALRAVVKIAIDPFVAGLAADTVIRAQFADRQALPKVLRDELRPSGPWMTSRSKAWAPPKVPRVLPMSPDNSVTHVSGLHRSAA